MPPRRTALCLAAATLFTAAAFAQAPGEYEMELWRSALRLDTPAAYEAYLKNFPQGAFADMARAALGRPAAAPAAAKPAAAAPVVPTSALAPFTGPVNSAATELALGARLVGPGIITVGQVANRRQFVVPAGEWVLLAAEDHSTRTTVPVGMATLAFGQFSGNQLRSLLVTSFNRRAVAPQGGNPGSNVAGGLLPTWRHAQRCEVAAPMNGLPENTHTRWLRRCAALHAAGDWRAGFPEASPLVEPVESALAELKATLPPAFAHRTEVHLSDIRYGYLVVTRLDRADVGTAAERAAWVRRYAALAERGYTREFESNDLVPGSPNPTREFDLAD